MINWGRLLTYFSAVVMIAPPAYAGTGTVTSDKAEGSSGTSIGVIESAPNSTDANFAKTKKVEAKPEATAPETKDAEVKSKAAVSTDQTEHAGGEKSKSSVEHKANFKSTPADKLGGTESDSNVGTSPESSITKTTPAANVGKIVPAPGPTTTPHHRVVLRKPVNTAEGKDVVAKKKTVTKAESKDVIAKKKPENLLQGFKLYQRQRIMGQVEIGVCPAGVTFTTAMVNGFIDLRKQPAMMFFTNDDNKTYKTLPVAEFDKMKKRHSTGQLFNSRPQEWKQVLLEDTIKPGKPILGHKTEQVEFLIKLTTAPYVEFPNTLLFSKDIECNPEAFVVVFGLMGFERPKKVFGVPLYHVETRQINPTKTVVSLDTKKIEPHKFTEAEFSVPKGYRSTESDDEVFTLGF